MSIFRYDPMRDLARLRDEIGRFMEPFRFTGREASHWQPSVDVFETESDVVVRAELPGIDPKDVDIRVTEDSLSIKGESKREETSQREGYFYTERQYGSFYRSVPFPVEVRPHQARAVYRDGLLEVRVPKETDGKGRGHRVNIERIQ